ncbi:MAG TPA: glutamate racemase [Candidatus Paceibacterota bacterium]|nr:glutamate racemase [Candidatus Paceibacterota bacterium]
MLGFFDSGLGGLSVLKEVEKELPQYSYLYLGDNARTPYGSHSHETIYRFTKQGVAYLFGKGAELIVLACNTASSSALRRIQQEFLPKFFPNKRVLGIIIPTAEEVVLKTKTGEVGILATEATVHSFAYPKEITKQRDSIKVHQQAGTLLVPIIEAGELSWEGLDSIVKKYLKELFERSSKIDTLVLGCTHYALIEDIINKNVPNGVNVISQGKIIADKLKNYLECHPEIESKLVKGDDRKFFSTEDSWRVRNLFKLFYGQPVDVKKISLR